MKALVIFDSVFGNIEKIARAVEKAWSMPKDVQVIWASEIKEDQFKGGMLLLVGSPTCRFRPT